MSSRQYLGITCAALLAAIAADSAWDAIREARQRDLQLKELKEWGRRLSAENGPPQAPAAATPAKMERKKLGEGVWLEIDGDKRLVVVDAQVCLRSGEYGLECLLCRRGTKEHESILQTSADAQVIHAALLVARAEAGHPVQFLMQGFKPPTGSTIKISLRYKKDGKTVTVLASQWVRHSRTKKDLEHNWVFAGSVLWKDPEDKERPPIYLANSDGGYICVTNVPTAMLDLPINSPKGLEERAYEPHTERIPELQTKVEIILEPVASRAEKPK